jgi:hypothetical protein
VRHAVPAFRHWIRFALVNRIVGLCSAPHLSGRYPVIFFSFSAAALLVIDFRQMLHTSANNYSSRHLRAADSLTSVPLPTTTYSSTPPPRSSRARKLLRRLSDSIPASFLLLTRRSSSSTDTKYPIYPAHDISLAASQPILSMPHSGPNGLSVDSINPRRTASMDQSAPIKATAAQVSIAQGYTTAPAFSGPTAAVNNKHHNQTTALSSSPLVLQVSIWPRFFFSFHISR